jgi:hypothetical protein
MKTAAQCAFGPQEPAIEVVKELRRIREKVRQVLRAIDWRGVHDMDIIQSAGTQIEELQPFAVIRILSTHVDNRLQALDSRRLLAIKIQQSSARAMSARKLLA